MNELASTRGKSEAHKSDVFMARLKIKWRTKIYFH